MRANLLKFCLAAFAIIILIKIGFFPSLLLFITMGVVPIINLELDPMTMLAIQGLTISLLSFFVGYQFANNIARVKNYKAPIQTAKPITRNKPTKKPTPNLKTQLTLKLHIVKKFCQFWQAKSVAATQITITKSKALVKKCLADISKIIQQIWLWLRQFSKKLKKIAIRKWPSLKKFFCQLPKHFKNLLKLFYSSIERTVAWFRHN